MIDIMLAVEQKRQPEEAKFDKEKEQNEKSLIDL